MSKLMKKNLKQIKTYKPGKPIEEVKRELGLKNVIKLASNESPFPPSKKVRKAIQKKLSELNRYPDGGSFYLKDAIAEKYKIKPENIIIGNGSDEIIIFAIRTFCQKNDNIIIGEPTFLMYNINAQIENIKVNKVPLSNGVYDLEQIARKINKDTKIIFLANPNAPTSTYINKLSFNKFIKKVPKSCILFMDEAYYEFACAIKDYPDTLPLIKKKGLNLIVTRTFSKVYALAGLRVGYGIANSELISAMEKVRDPFNINSIAQTAAETAIKDKDYVKKVLKEVEKGKDHLYMELDKLEYEYFPSATNFILIKTKGDSKSIYEKLLKKGVIVREMSGWGMNGYIRVTIGTDAENKKFIAELKKI
ncbi:MAG: histidinol-phosphate transaminase [Candidatus Omnitrophica bacterium]|nr:histidinol-phosphate transaminase [Candidatus Omnitrophota bacterium]